MMTPEQLEAIRQRAKSISGWSYYRPVEVGVVVFADIPALLAEVERLRGVQKSLSNNYVSLFVSYAELLDDYLPEWREVNGELVAKLKAVVNGD